MAVDLEGIRVGVLGAGFAAGRHVERLMTMDDVCVVGVADLDLDRSRALADRAGARAVADVRELIDLGLDCLYVCVPPHQHGEPERRAVDAGLPLYIEKPIAGDRGTAEELGRLLDERGHLAVVGYQWRWLDTWERARELLRDRPVRLVVGSWLDKAPRVPWWAVQAESGGQVVEQLTHVLDVARSLVGEPEVMSATGAADAAGPGDIWHATSSTVLFDSGAVGSFTSTCLLPGGYRMAAELVAPGLLVRITERDLTVVDAEGEHHLEPRVDPILRCSRAFLDAVRGEEAELRTSYAEALRTHRFACAIAEAAGSRAPALGVSEPGTHR